MIKIVLSVSAKELNKNKHCHINLQFVLSIKKLSEEKTSAQIKDNREGKWQCRDF